MAERRAGMFFEQSEDPRAAGATSLGNEKETLVEYIRYQRLTLEAKCSGLDPEQLARRSVPPSTMSLLGLVRHMAEVERSWFQRVLAGRDAPHLYRSPEEPDADFDGAVADADVVEEAWAHLKAEQDFADGFIASSEDLGKVWDYPHGQVSLREVLVHIVEEYARHNGHADLLREGVDGRRGE